MVRANDRVVSSEREELILVDEADNEIGTLHKAECHDGDGILHRAFSVFLFDESGRLLLQQRSAEKRLWPLYWSNSCCSHPRAGEEMTDAVERRVREELGVDCATSFVFKFRYQVSYRELGAEHELCSVFLGRLNGPVRPNVNEIAATRFVTPTQLAEEFATEGALLTPWFRLEWERLTAEHARELGRYTAR